MKSIVENCWDTLVTEFSQINEANSLNDGAGNFRTSPKFVYKQILRLDQVEMPSIAIAPSPFVDVVPQDTNFTTFKTFVEFRLIGYVGATTGDVNQTNFQSLLNAEYHKLLHDMIRVSNSVMQKYIAGEPRFIIDAENRKMRIYPMLDVKEFPNKAAFGFQLPVELLWHTGGWV